MPPTNNNVWSSNVPTGAVENITLPSGQTCDARKIGMEGLIVAGVMEEADSLSVLVDTKHLRKVRGAKGRVDGTEIDPGALMRDGKALAGMTSMVDKCLPLIVADPPVSYHLDGDGLPIPVNQRKAGQVYTDQIDMLDKFELFTWSVGSLGDLESFRKQTAPDVAGVGDGQAVPRPSKRAARTRR